MWLPILKGVSAERLKQIVGVIPLHFLKYLDGETLLQEGDAMTHLTFLINGSVRVDTANATERFRVGQTLTAPAVVCPDYLFGRTTKSPSRVTASGAAGIVKVAKADFINMLKTDDVILFNYLNLLAAGAQTRIDGILSLTDGKLEERIAFWIVALTQRGGHDIVLSCRHRELSSFFGVQRSMFNQTLESMAERGIITYSTTEIRPTSREALVALLVNSGDGPEE